MMFQMMYHNPGFPRLHSTDLTDMRAALLDDGDDDDGPDGGSPNVHALPTGRARQDTVTG